MIKRTLTFFYVSGRYLIPGVDTDFHAIRDHLLLGEKGPVPLIQKTSLHTSWEDGHPKRIHIGDHHPDREEQLPGRDGLQEVVSDHGAQDWQTHPVHVAGTGAGLDLL